MTPAKKIALTFGVSGIVLIAGILLANMSPSAAVITAGCMGLAFSAGWLFLYARELP